jgi:ATP-dependent DNA helicase RecG
MNIKELVGEATEYDKKQAVESKKPKSWCKSVCAFANGAGGTLYFGVADDGTIVGLNDAKRDAEIISETIKVHLNPIPDVKISFEKVGELTIVVVEVVSGTQTPYYYEGDGQLIAYVRIGNESVPAEPLKIRELVIKGSGETYDSLKSKYNFSDMSFTKLKSVYKQRTGNTFEETDYESFGLVDENGNLTNAGALLADESPVKQSRLFCTRWSGTTKADGIIDALDDKEYSGGLVILLQAGIDFVTNNSKKAWKKVSNGRIEMPDYPERAVLEGIVNALIHRSYTELGSEVHIDMFDDRIEIYSPGGMVSGISLKDRDILKIPSKRRNPVLADIFSRLKYMERRGSGFKKILSDYEKQENYTEKIRPIFDGEYDDFTLTLFNVNYSDTQCDTQDDTQDDTQENIEEKIIELVRDNNKISTKKMAEKLNVGVSTVKRKIKNMPNIHYVGSGYSGHWEIKN